MILNLFPTPVYFERETGYEFTQNEIDILDSIPMFEDNGKSLSTDVNILETYKLYRIRNFCQKHLDLYLKHNCKVEQEFYIHRSWLTKKEISQNHQLHDHPNSIVSGIFYLHAPPDSGTLEFVNHENNFLNKRFDFTYDFTEFNHLNSTSCHLDVCNTSMVIFPSWLRHSVANNRGNQSRVCIAFNAFVKDYFQTYVGWSTKYDNSLI